jgi:hypothetical protein
LLLTIAAERGTHNDKIAGGQHDTFAQMSVGVTKHNLLPAIHIVAHNGEGRIGWRIANGGRYLGGYQDATSVREPGRIKCPFRTVHSLDATGRCCRLVAGQLREHCPRGISNYQITCTSMQDDAGYLVAGWIESRLGYRWID